MNSRSRSPHNKLVCPMSVSTDFWISTENDRSSSNAFCFICYNIIAICLRGALLNTSENLKSSCEDLSWYWMWTERCMVIHSPHLQFLPMLNELKPQNRMFSTELWLNTSRDEIVSFNDFCFFIYYLSAGYNKYNTYNVDRSIKHRTNTSMR